MGGICDQNFDIAIYNRGLGLRSGNAIVAHRQSLLSATCHSHQQSKTSIQAPAPRTKRGLPHRRAPWYFTGFSRGSSRADLFQSLGNSGGRVVLTLCCQSPGHLPIDDAVRALLKGAESEDSIVQAGRKREMRSTRQKGKGEKRNKLGPRAEIKESS